MSSLSRCWTDSDGRAPRGARGLKYVLAPTASAAVASCPSRGTWIEIDDAVVYGFHVLGRAPRGARGLKCVDLVSDKPLALGRAPRGARGLK